MTADDSLIINHDPHYQELPIEETSYADLGVLVEASREI